MDEAYVKVEYATIEHMKQDFSFTEQTLERYRDIQALLDQLDPDREPQALIVLGSPLPSGDIIVFPGSFNPPTNAHLALLEQARQFAHKHINAIGAGTQPENIHLYAAMSKRITDKEHVDRPLILDRILLLNDVLQHHLQSAGIMLFNRGLYVEQAQGVHSAFPTVKRLFFLIGYDKIVQILDPHYYKDRDVALNELFSLAELLVAPRGNDGPDQLYSLLNQPQNKPFTSHIHALPFDTAYRDFSSTRIREHPAEFHNDVPPEVQQFIQQTHAYEPPAKASDGSGIDYYGEHVKALEAALGRQNVT
jgi:nicotinamide-nucleotide adenylyltransferase